MSFWLRELSSAYGANSHNLFCSKLDLALNLTASVSGAFDLIRFTLRQGPLAFYKGYVPAFVRLGPHTVLTFIFLEQLKKNFGRLREED